MSTIDTAATIESVLPARNQCARPSPPYRRIAVIGAGAGGLTATRALLAEGSFELIDVYEQRSQAGGTWNHTSETIECPLPSTDPNEELRDDVSAIYDDLETNIPHPLMEFPGHPFPEGLPLLPRHEAVLDYLLAYAKPINHLIQYNTRVVSISRSGTDNKEWLLTSSSTRPDNNARTVTKSYDALLLSPGHYSHPFLPSLSGLATFPASKISHSHSFRSPSQFRDKRVLVVGNSASGFDIALQLSAVVRAPLLQAIRSPSAISAPDRIKALPALTGLRGPGTAVFADGTEEHDIGHVIFCTGYLYTLPFLAKEDRERIITHGKRMAGLYRHVIAIHDPSIAVIGGPIKVVPFPLSHNQAGWVAGVWSGRVPLPSEKEMRKWEEGELVRRGGEATFEFFSFPADADYLEELADLTEGEGTTWTMKRWDKRERWIRKLTPEIKKRWVRLKKEGVMARTWEDMGLAWDEENGEGRDLWEEKNGEKFKIAGGDIDPIEGCKSEPIDVI